MAPDRRRIEDVVDLLELLGKGELTRESVQQHANERVAPGVSVREYIDLMLKGRFWGYCADGTLKSIPFQPEYAI